MDGAADGSLLGRKKLKRRIHDAFVVAVVKHAKGALDAKVGGLLGSLQTLELHPIVADVEILIDPEGGFFLETVRHRAGNTHHDQNHAEMDDESTVAPLVAPGQSH